MKNQQQVQNKPGEFKVEKLSLIQKNLLLRWINTLNVQDTFFTLENIYEELKSGVLICEILKFHQPNLDFTGVNVKAIAKKQRINNIEKAISILYQKGASPRLIPTAEEIFEADKNQDKIWLLLKQIFDMFAMHDVIVLMPKIIKWINQSISYYQPQGSQQRWEYASNKADDLYQDFKSGVTLALLLFLYEEKAQLDFKMIYEHPINKQELLSNLSYVFQIAYNCNLPVYFKPQEYIEYDQPNFLLTQLYYMYCRYKHLKPRFTQENLTQIIFKDEGRIIEDKSSYVSSTPKRQQTDSSEVPTSSMGIIDEVDSVDFSSTMTPMSAQQNRQGNNFTGLQSDSKQSKTTGKKMQQFLNPNQNPLNSQQQQKIQCQNQQNNNMMKMGEGQRINRDLGDEDVEDDDNQFDNQSDFQQLKKNLSQASSNLLLQKSNNKYQNSISEQEQYSLDNRFGGNLGVITHISNKPSAALPSSYQIANSEEIGGGIFGQTLGLSSTQFNNTGQTSNLENFSSQFPGIGFGSQSLQKDNNGLSQQKQQNSSTKAVPLTSEATKSLNTYSEGGLQIQIQERRGMFFEDLRCQIEINNKQKQRQQVLGSKIGNSQVEAGINEEQIAQMYFSSGTANQTAHFSNFNTLQQQQQIQLQNQLSQNAQAYNLNQPKSSIQENQVPIGLQHRQTLTSNGTNHAKSDSLMGGMRDQIVGSIQNQHYFGGNNQAQSKSQSVIQKQQQYVMSGQQDHFQEYQQEKLLITDENGDLDEMKCLSMLFIPQLVTIQINNQQTIKSIIYLKACESFYNDFIESYSLRIIEQSPQRKQITELKLQNIDTILVKNMIQKQFMISAENGRIQLLLDTNQGEVKNEICFQALNYIFQRYSNKQQQQRS